MITSVGNPVVRRVRRLRKRMWRERTGRILVEGHRAVRSALFGGRVEVLLYTGTGERLRAEVVEEARAAGARTHEVAPSVMSYLTSATTAPDVLAVALMPSRSLASTGSAPRGIVLTKVHDPATLGSMMATAVAVDAPTIVIGPECADVFGPKCVRAAQGAHFLAPVVRDVEIGDAVTHLRAAGSTIVSLAASGPPPWDVKLAGPMMLLVSGDEAGPGADADEVVSVPSAGPAPSLSVQAAVVLYEWVRQGGARS